MRRVMLSLAAALSSLAFAPAPFPKTRSKQRVWKQLQGVWYVKSLASQGAARPHQVLTLEVSENRWAFRGRDRVVVGEYVIELHLDTVPTSFTLKHSSRPGGICRGLYRIEGDSLTICCAPLGAPAPAGFDTGKRGSTLWVFSRK
jgi:uncharacterized protein (TIGR03067 family)